MLKEAGKIWKRIFGNWRYVVLTLIVGFIFFLINGIILNINNFGSSAGLGFFGGVKLFTTLFLGFGSQVKLHSLITTFIISLLIGILFSLIAFKVKSTQSKSKKSGIWPGIGAFIAAFAPGCAACGIGLVAALGLSGAAINFFPFNGLEISIASILILGIAIFKISKDLAKPPECKVDLNKKTKGENKK